MNYIIKFFVLLVFFTQASFASDQAVSQFVNDVAHKVIAVVTSKTTSESQKKSAITTIITTDFDVNWMSRFVLGRNFRALSASQQQEYEALYLHYLVGIYFPILMQYDNDKFVIDHITKSSKTSYDVDTTIQRINKPSVSIRYHINEISEGQFKTVDMVVEGISTIISQRSEFDSIIQQDGIAGFMQKMKEKYS